MQYIILSNDSFILKIGSKTQTFSIKSFNYHKIKNLINYNADEEEILPLMETPELPEGVYELYGDLVTKEMYAIQYRKDAQSKRHTINYVDPNKVPDKTLKPKFIGVYSSLSGIKEDWPEYFL